MVDATAVKGASQRSGDMVLSDYVGQLPRAISAIERQCHARTLVGLTDVPPLVFPAFHPFRRVWTYSPETDANRSLSPDWAEGVKGTPRAPARALLPLLPSGPGGVRRDDATRGVGPKCKRVPTSLCVARLVKMTRPGLYPLRRRIRIVA